MIQAKGIEDRHIKPGTIFTNEEETGVWLRLSDMTDMCLLDGGGSPNFSLCDDNDLADTPMIQLLEVEDTAQLLRTLKNRILKEAS